jgi:hypothetical protein
MAGIVHVVFGSGQGATAVGVGPLPGTIQKLSGGVMNSTGGVTTPGSVVGNEKIKYSAEEVEAITQGRCNKEVIVESGIEEGQWVKLTAESEAEAAKFIRCFLGAGSVTGELITVGTTNWKSTSAI